MSSYVELPIGSGAVRPVSGFFVTVGLSGERKSATDEQVAGAVRDREAARDVWGPAYSAWKNANDAFEAERKKILASTKGNVLTRKAELDALGDAPEAPLQPIIVCEEPTAEGLIKALMAGQPSMGIMSSEGGQFVGGHAMSDEAKMRSATTLSKLWDGDVVKRIRAGDGAHTIAGKRLAMHLMMQPGVAAGLIADPVLRDQGLASRMLITAPTTTMGTRLQKPTDYGSLKIIAQFRATLAERMNRLHPLRDGNRNELAPRIMPMSGAAKTMWLKFADHIELLLAPGRELEPVSGFAAKMPEHAARIAAVLEWWRDPNACEIASDTLRGAISLAQHYGGEALRLYDAAGVTGDTADAERLRVWLIERWDAPHISVAEIVQSGPRPLRTAKRAREIVKVLVDHRWLVPAASGVKIKGKPRRDAWSISGRA